MINIVGVRFKSPGKIYYFDPGNFKLEQGTEVIVETSLGDEYGEVVIPNKEVEESTITEPLKKIIRVVTYKDKRIFAEYKAKEQEALDICIEKVKKHGLEMKVTGVEYKFDGSKLTFYFTADGRIDFRELVKDLASVFRTRIELRQIGVRDEVRRLGGNGVCGRELCCCSFLGNFETVSIKMAKEQNLSLNPSKILGNCGRLMCCLKYEHNVYEDKLKHLPRIGAIVKTEDGTGEVCGVETLKECVRVRLKEGDETFFKKYDAKDIIIIKDAEEEQEKLYGEDAQNLKELEKIEKLERIEKDNTKDNI